MFPISFDSHQFHTSQQVFSLFPWCVRLSTRGSGYRNLRADCVLQAHGSQTRRRDGLWAKLRGRGLTWVHLGTQGLGLGKGMKVEKNRICSTKCRDSSVVDPENATVRGRDRHCEGMWHQNVEVSALLALKFGLNPKMSQHGHSRASRRSLWERTGVGLEGMNLGSERQAIEEVLRGENLTAGEVWSKVGMKRHGGKVPSRELRRVVCSKVSAHCSVHRGAAKDTAWMPLDGPVPNGLHPTHSTPSTAALNC